MADYAIGLSFHKANRTLVRAVELTPPNRYFATRSSTGAITLPQTHAAPPAALTYIQLQGLTQVNFQINDSNQDFRLLGDDGWNDSLITGSGVQASCTGYFLKDTELGSNAVPEFRGGYDEGFALIEKSRYNKDYEIYIEFLKELGAKNPAGSAAGDDSIMYDYSGFNAVVSNYSEAANPDGLTEVSFDLVSRGKPVFGLYDSDNATPIPYGSIQ